MLLCSHGGGNCSGDGGTHEGGPDLHPTGYVVPTHKPFEMRSVNDSSAYGQMCMHKTLQRTVQIQ